MFSQRGALDKKILHIYWNRIRPLGVHKKRKHFWCEKLSAFPNKSWALPTSIMATKTTHLFSPRQIGWGKYAHFALSVSTFLALNGVVYNFHGIKPRLWASLSVHKQLAASIFINDFPMVVFSYRTTTWFRWDNACLHFPLGKSFNRVHLTTYIYILVHIFKRAKSAALILNDSQQPY